MHRIDGFIYRCTGTYYGWVDADQDFSKRATLDILREGDAVAPKDSPNAVVVMMNPGSSAPLQGYAGRQSEGVAVPAMPDKVQYQIMRLMAAADWSHVRIVNLADIRAASSADLRLTPFRPPRPCRGERADPHFIH